MLIGRQDEISNLTRMLRGGVVCVVGPPGVGKSALARAALPRDGLRIDCSGAQSSDQLLQRLTSALALPDGPGRGPRLVHALAGARAVLLDDVDDVLAASEDLAKSWLDLVPGLTVITTSRAPLRAAGAELLELAPLAPSDGAALLLRSAGPRAGLDPDDDTLLALSEALDGLPLALTLAGDRLRLLTPAQLLAASAPTTLLGGALGRTIDSARTSLTPPAAEALTRLSCFHGAFGLPEALAVLGPDGMDALQELRDDSVLSSEGGRFRLLRAVRERVASSLPSLPDHAAVRSAHAQAVLAASEREHDALPHPDDLVAALATLGGQELAARLSLPVMRRQLSIAQRVALLADADDRALGSLASLQASAGQLVEARSTCEAMLETDPHRVSAWRLLAHVALRDGDQPAAGHAIQTALDLDPTPDERAAVLMERALLRLDAGDFAAGLEDLTEAQALHTQVKNDDGAARAGLRRALLELAAGQREEGVRSLLRVLPTLDALGLQPLAATARHYLALVALHIGDDEGAAAHLDTAETLWDAAGDSLGLARVAGLRGVLAMLHGDLDEARRQFEEAALAREPAGRPRWSALLLEGRAILAARRGEPVMARQRLAQADALAGGLPVADVQGLQRTKLALESGVDPTPDVSLRGRLLAGLDLNVPPPRYPTLVLGPQARWFEVTGERVDLSRRGAPRRILLALAQAPEGLDIHGVVEAGWPGEALHPEAGRARAYTAVRSLRRFGLQDVLVTGDDGYRLDAVIQRG